MHPRPGIITAIVLVAILISVARAAEIPTTPAPEARAEGLYRPDDLVRALDNARRHPWATEQYQEIIERADRWVDKDEAFLAEWVPEFTPLRPVDCPACGQPWRYNWDLAPGDNFKIKCKKCGVILPNEKFPADDVEVVTDRMGRRQEWPVHKDAKGKIYRYGQRAGYHRLTQLSVAEDVALAWAFTGDRAYAESARRILLACAAQYPGYLYHNWERFMDEPAGWAGKISGWRLDDAKLGLAWMAAYDLIRDSGVLSDAEKATIEKNLVRELADLLTAVGAVVTNADGDILSAVAYAGVLLEDHDLVAYSLEPPRGFKGNLDRLFLPDGSWWEGSFSYAAMMLNGMNQHPEILLGYTDPPSYSGPNRYDNLNLYADPRLENIYLFASRALMPDGSLPPFNDSHVGAGLMPILAEIAVTRYGPQNVAALVEAYDGNPAEKGSRFALFHREPAINFGQVQGEPRATLSLPDYGAAILRSRSHSGGQFPVNDLAAVVDFGPHGAWHGHNDKLNMIFYAYGEELGMDLGYVHAGYEKRPWMVSALAHNLVVIDEKDQAETTGTLERIHSDERTEVAIASAPAAYPGLADEYWRMTAIVNARADAPAYIVDGFYVKGGTTHDWTFQTEGGLKGLTDAEGAELQLADHDASGWKKNSMYKWLSEISRVTADANFISHWKNGDVTLRAHMLGAPGTQVFRAKMPGQRHSGAAQYQERPLDKLIVRRSAGDSSANFFISVMEPIAPGKQPFIESVRLIESQPEAGRAIVEVALADGRVDRVVLDRSQKEGSPLE